MVGTTISHYKVLEKIGQGGMGGVFLAQDTKLDRKVALKFLPDFLQEDPTAKKRFLREAKSAVRPACSFIALYLSCDVIRKLSNTDANGRQCCFEHCVVVEGGQAGLLFKLPPKLQLIDKGLNG